MDNFFLSAIAREMEPEVRGGFVAKVYLSNSNLILDLRLESGQMLVCSVDPSSPALYFTAGSPRGIESDVSSTHPFALQLRKRIEGGKLLSMTKAPLDRLVRFDFEKYDAGGDRVSASVVLALTGRAANAFLFDSGMSVVAALSDRTLPPELHWQNDEAGLSESLLSGLDDDSLTEPQVLELKFGPSSIFSPLMKKEFLARAQRAAPVAAYRSLVGDLQSAAPTPIVYSTVPVEDIPARVINLKTDLVLSQIELTSAAGLIETRFATLSRAADAYYAAREAQKKLQLRFTAARQFITQEIRKRESALAAIEDDRERFEDPDRLKRAGDLLLANLSTARVEGSTATVVDFYDPDQREVKIDVEEGKPLQQSAAGYFARYQKARRALETIKERERKVAKNLPALKAILQNLGAAPTSAQIDEARAEAEKEAGLRIRTARHVASKEKSSVAGRRFKTTEGFEVVVGRNDRENDHLTFRESRPSDIWLHAADYPGSHVIVRNPRREAVPHKTIIEAAELAAFYSQARNERKAAVHYTEKKFVSKPPRAKPGLARLSSFKTVMVEPRCELDRWD